MLKTSDIIWQDAQHQVLFEILDIIKQPDSDEQVLYKLRDYTENHFSLEEQYMEVLAYPDREAHIQAHNRFREEIDKLLSQGELQDALFRDLVSTFLTEWLTRHVFGIDKKLEDYILQAELK